MSDKLTRKYARDHCGSDERHIEQMQRDEKFRAGFSDTLVGAALILVACCASFIAIARVLLWGLD